MPSPLVSVYVVLVSPARLLRLRLIAAISPALLAMFVALFVTAWLVANSWEPLTASVDVAGVWSGRGGERPGGGWAGAGVAGLAAIGRWGRVHARGAIGEGGAAGVAPGGGAAGAARDGEPGGAEHPSVAKTSESKSLP